VLRYAAGCDQARGRKWRLQRLNIARSAHLRAREEFYVIRAGAYACKTSVGVRAPGMATILLTTAYSTTSVTTPGAGKEKRSRIAALFRGREVEHRARAYDDFRMLGSNAGDDFERAGCGEGNFDNRNPRVSHGFGGEEGLFGGCGTNGGNDSNPLIWAITCSFVIQNSVRSLRRRVNARHLNAHLRTPEAYRYRPPPIHTEWAEETHSEPEPPAILLRLR